jgi:Flp pilus assembly protein TadG
LRRLRPETGAAMVEFALASTILLTLVFGVLGMSMALYSYHYVSYAAREGTRYAIVRGSTCPAALSGCPAYGTGVDVQTYLRGFNYPGIKPSALTVTTTWPSSSGCSPSSNPCDNPGNLVQVTVSYVFPVAVPFVPLNNLTMTSTSQMVISQ